MRSIKKGATDQSVVIRVVDSTDGTPETGFAFDTTGIDLWYRREGATKTSITEVTLAALDTAHADGGVKHIGDGYVRLDLPDAAVATGSNGVMVGGTATGMVVIGCYVHLVDFDPQDAVRLGLTALPNAAADAAGGLPISDAGGLDLDAQIVTKINDILTDTGTTLQGELDGIQADTEDIQTRIPAALVGGRIDANVGAISADSVAADNAEAFFDGTGYAGTGNVIPTVTTLTNLPAITANWLTAAGTAADFGTEVGTAVWASATRTVTSLSGLTVDTVTTLTNLPAITANWLTAAGTAADFGTEVGTAVWASATRTLTSLAGLTVDTVTTVTNAVTANVTSISGDSTAADNLEAAYDGTGYAHTANTYPWTAAWDAEVQSEVNDGLVAFFTSAAALVDLVWDEVLTGATHNVTNSAGRRLRSLDATSIWTGTAQSGADNSITLDTGASATNEIYGGNIIVITAGTGAGQTRFIAEYNGSTKVVLVDQIWVTNPDVTSEFQIVANRQVDISQHGLAAGGGASTITLNSTASATDDIYNGQTIIIRTSNGTGQARLITDYVGSTKVATVAPAWQVEPTSASVYAILPVGSVIVEDFNSGALADIQQEATDALNAYDPPTNAELSTAQGVITALLPAALVSGRMDSSVGAMASNTLTAAATAADFGTEIGTAVWASATRTVTSLSGLTVDTVTTLTNLPAITANWLTAAGTASDFGTEVGTAVWASATRTVTSLSGLTVDTVTTLTNLPAITANWLTSTGIASSAGNKIADHARRRTQANVEASSDGDTLDVSSEYGFIQQAQESAISGTTLTIKKTDGTTTLGTKTVATNASADPVTGVS